MARNLTDLGLSAPTKSGAQQQAPSIDSLLRGASGINQNKAQAAQAQAAIQQIQQGGTKGTLGRILSPQGISVLLAALAAGAGGGGAGGALGVGLGGLEGIAGSAAAEVDQKTQLIEQLQKTTDEALKRADKAQQRAQDLVLQNPDLFTNPETGEQSLTPSELGNLLLGEDVKLYAHSRRVLNERQESWKRNFDAIEGGLKRTTSLADARVLSKSLFGLVGGQTVSEGVTDALARAMGTDKFPQAFINTMLDQFGSSGLAAIKKMFDEGLSPSDSEVWRGLVFDETNAISPTELDDVIYNNLLMEVTKWQKKNPVKVSALRAKAGDNEDKFLELVADAALAGRSGEQTLYRNKSVALFGGSDRFRRFNRALDQIGEDYGFVDIRTQIENLKLSEGQTKDQIDAKKIDLANKLLGETERAANNSKADRSASLGLTIETRLRAEGQVTVATAADLKTRIYKQAVLELMDASGRIDEVKLEQRINELIIEQLEIIKKQRGE